MVSRTELLGSDLRKGSRQSEGGAEVGLGVPSEKLNQLVGSGVRMSLRRGQTWGWGVRRSPREASVPCGQFRDPDHNLQMAGQVGEGVNLSPHFPIPAPTHTHNCFTPVSFAHALASDSSVPICDGKCSVPMNVIQAIHPSSRRNHPGPELLGGRRPEERGRERRGPEQGGAGMGMGGDGGG